MHFNDLVNIGKVGSGERLEACLTDVGKDFG